MNVLVTGGKGFIGKNFINYISKKKNITIFKLPRDIDLSKSNVVDNFFKHDNNSFVISEIFKNTDFKRLYRVPSWYRQGYNEELYINTSI